jgi:uncharacterized protein (DUF2249 family)
MVINSQTKIATLIKHHPDVLEAIVTLSPDFKKLRNPVLRKLMAGRTSIAMASKIGGCKPEDFFEKLKPYGFDVDDNCKVEQEDTAEQKPTPKFIKDIGPDKIVSLDVRLMLAEGNDPLKLIQQKVKELKQGEALRIINTFEPTPLIKLLTRQGFKSYVEVLDTDLIHTTFYKNTSEQNAQIEAKQGETSDWEELLDQYKNRLQQIDVRHLEMPLPMMNILEALETIPVDKALLVHHKRIPVFLLTELKERQFDYRIKEAGEGEVHLLIFKN